PAIPTERRSFPCCDSRFPPYQRPGGATSLGLNACDVGCLPGRIGTMSLSQETDQPPVSAAALSERPTMALPPSRGIDSAATLPGCAPETVEWPAVEGYEIVGLLGRGGM